MIALKKYYQLIGNALVILLHHLEFHLMDKLNAHLIMDVIVYGKVI